MMTFKIKEYSILKTIVMISLILFFAPMIVLSQETQINSQAVAKDIKGKRKGEFYVSWGYNTEWYTHTNIHVNQPALNSNYTLEDIVGHDHQLWNTGIFNKAITIPQFSCRAGYFFNDAKDLGIELNYDHCKFIVVDGQTAHMVGTFRGKAVDTNFVFAWPHNQYFLNNGANFILVNLVKRMHIIKDKNEYIKVDALGKVGFGPTFPHVQNTLFDLSNKGHFQVGGFNEGLEAGIKITFFKYIYIEYTNKLDWADYYGLRLSTGTSHQAFGTYEMIGNIGITFPMGPRVKSN
jgi:hypothetical protein